MRWCFHGLLLLLAASAGSGAMAAAAENPTITAQGFAMGTTLQSEAGRFEPVRVRVEAPARIAKLVIEQGDLETDLTTTTDRSLFGLFGLDKRPMNAFDITMDFAPYINARLTAPATYAIAITVIDREGLQSQATLTVTVIGEEIPAAESAPIARRLEGTEATFRRQGSGPVESVGPVQLTWITIEPIDVTVRLRAANALASLRPLARSSWNDVKTPEDLRTIVSRTPPVPYFDVPAARSGAAGAVFVLSDDSSDALIHLTGSTTAVSPMGTTVTLTASVRR